MRKIVVLFDRYGTIRIVTVKVKRQGLYLNQISAKAKKEKILDTAIQFARMWGVAETLDETERLLKLDYQSYIKAWAKKFVLQKKDNKTEFFEKQIKKLI